MESTTRTANDESKTETPKDELEFSDLTIISGAVSATGGDEDILQADDIIKDTKLAWVKCFAAFFIQLNIVGVLHIFGVFFVEFIKEFKTSKATAAWVGSVAYGITMALAPVASASIGWFGVRYTILAGTAMCMVSLIITSYVTSMEWMFLTFSILYGIGTSLAYTPTMTIADDYFSKYLSIATGFTVSGSSMGTLTLSPVGQALIDAFGWRQAMRLLSICSGIGFICGLAFKPKAPKSETAAERVKKSPVRRLVADLHLWKNKVYVVWVIGITSVMFGYYIPYVHMVSHAMTLGIPASKGSILMLALGASTATGRIMFGKIITFGILDRLHMHMLSMVITGVACMMVPLIKTFAGLMTYVICVGLVDGCFVVMMPLLTLTLAGVENKVNAWGYLVGVSSITFMLGPPVAGWIYDATGSYNMAFHIAAVPILLGPVILLFIPWAQRTAETVNDALSVVGDVDSEGGSLSICDDASIMSAWAAPPPRSHHGSQRSSMRSFAVSHKRDSGTSSWRKKTPSENVDIQDIHLSVPESLHPKNHHCSESVLPGNSDLACATSLEAGSHNAPKSPRGRRFRSYSESHDDRSIHWFDQVDSPRPAFPPQSVQSDPENPTFYMLSQETISSTDHVVEVCDDLLSIFKETSTNPSYSNRSGISGGQASLTSPSNSRTSTPIPISHSSTSNNATLQEQDSQGCIPLVGSPPHSDVKFCISPTNLQSPPNEPSSNIVPEIISQSSPPWSSHLLPIPENQQLQDPGFHTVSAESCSPLQGQGNFTVDSAPNSAAQQIFQPHHLELTDQVTSGSGVSQGTDSSVSVQTSSSESATMPDTQTIFPLDVSEGSTDEVPTQDQNQLQDS